MTGATLDTTQPPPATVVAIQPTKQPAKAAQTTPPAKMTTALTAPPPIKPLNKPHPDHAKHLAEMDLFGAPTQPKKKATKRIGDIATKIAKLEKQVAKNPHPYLVQSLADHRALLQSLKDLPLYIEHE